MDAFEAISLPDSTPLVCRRRFSIDEANRAITLVRRIVSDIVREYGKLRQLHGMCRACEAEGETAKADEFRGQYALITDRLSGLREELEEIGCELKDYASGLVDFPATLNGRDVLLCWTLGEEQISFWHDVEGGAANRRPISECE